MSLPPAFFSQARVPFWWVGASLTLQPCLHRTDTETGERVDKEEVMVGKPLRFSETPAAPVGRGPLVGQHNDGIL